MPELVMIGTSHKTSPVAFRQKLALGPEQMPRALHALGKTHGVRECLILSTCNRVEIYASMDERAPATLLGFLTGRPVDASPLVYVKCGQEAVQHLCRVAVGIESLVPGEPEALGQVKEAYRAAVGSSVAGRGFMILFPMIFGLVKKIRSRLIPGGLSVAGVAVRLAKETFGSLAGRRVLVLGAGRIGEQAVASLKNEGVEEVLVSNRTFFKAVVLAEQIGGTPIMLHEIAQHVARTDILINSLGSPEPVPGTAAMDCLAGRKNPLLIIDTTVPGSVDPRIGGLAGARLYNIDDLAAAADFNAQRRKEDAAVVERIIASRAVEIHARFAADQLGDSFRDVRCEAEQLRGRRFEDAVAGLDVVSDGTGGSSTH